MSYSRPLVLLGLGLGAAHAQPKYGFAVLDTGRNVQIRDINDSGVAVGNYQITTSDPFRAFLLKDSVFKELGDFGGGTSSADGINNQGLIVGTAHNALKEARPFYRERDTLFEIMPYPSGFGLSVNDKGQVAGYTLGYGVAANRGYLFDHGLLKLLPEQFRPSAINDSGVMVGQADGKGAIWRGDTLVPLAPAGFTSIDAVDINNRGQVVGHVTRNDSVTAFIFENGVYHWLPHLEGRYTRAVAINDRGQVVGTTGYQGKGAPFLYEDGKMHALQALVDTALKTWILDVSCINNKGQIAVYAQKGERIHDWIALILTPMPSTSRRMPAAKTHKAAHAESGPVYLLDGRKAGQGEGRRLPGIRLRKAVP